MEDLVGGYGWGEDDFLQKEMLKKELEYVEKELAAEFVTEGESSSTTLKMNENKGRDIFSKKKWARLLAGAGMLLAAGGLHLSKKLQAFSKAEKNMDVPRLYSQQIEAQQDELINNVATLEDMWLISPADEAPLPVSKKEETSLRRQLTLVNCAVKAVQEQLSYLTELHESQKVLGNEGLPSLEQLKAQQSNLVSQNDLVQMLLWERDTAIADEEAAGRVTARFPRVLAEALANAVAHTELKVAAAGRLNKAFAPFLLDQEEADLSIPSGGRFRTAAFVGLLKGIQSRNNVLAFSSWQAMMQLADALSVEQALDVLRQLSNLAREEDEIRRDLIRAALQTPPKEVSKYVFEDEELYRTVLGLFDLGE
ncbi:hypothetical protein Esti_001142 [Eimeria stiedai]